MKLHQLQSLCAIVDHEFNISTAAKSLNATQPGISAQLKILEDQLGVTLIVRNKTKIEGLSEAGIAILPAVRRILADAENIRRTVQTVKDHSATKRLRIGTTHTHAMYTLRPVFKRFSQSHPKVLLELRQSNPTHIAELVASSEVDIGIAAEPLQRPLGLSFQPCFKIEHGVFMPRGHPLEAIAEVTLADLAQYPIITYDATFRLGRVVRHSFRAAGLRLNVAINATDSDTTKAFVESGLGIAILPKLVYDPLRDVGVSMVDVNHLFESSFCNLITVEGRELDGHQKDFVLEFFESAPAYVKQHLEQLATPA